MNRNRVFVLPLLSLLIGVLVGLGACELVLRLAGFQPWRYGTVNPAEPTMHEPDPILGWRNKQGSYLFPSYLPGTEYIRVTFVDGGLRATGTKMGPGRDRIAIIGCSDTQGWGLPDEETYPWKLQSLYPSVEVRNYGTAAYGTYQCLLTLERIFSEHVSPGIVIYSFIEAHEERNVATCKWLMLLSLFSKRGHVYIPYCTIDREGNLVRHPPECYPQWPLSDYLASINLLQKQYARMRTSRRTLQKRIVTEKLLLEMQNLCKKNNAQFIVAILNMGEIKPQYINFFKDHNIRCIDCAYPLTEDFQIPCDGHPNAKMNSLWAHCIGEAISRNISQLGAR